ncbi:MAG: hypothetical protein ABJZ55_23505 [Fuerstiella sp.]
MSRRKSDADQEFGSDSFLDIIANIVGILIILIVVAGAKVAQQAESRDPVAVQLSEGLDEIPKLLADPQLPSEPVAATVFPWSNESKELVPDAVVAPKVSDEELDAVRQRIAKLEAEKIEYLKQVEALTLGTQETLDSVKATAEKLARLQESYDKAESSEEDAALQFASLEREIRANKSTVADLKDELESEAKQEKLYRGTLATLDQRQSYVHDALKQVSLETRQLREVLKENQDNTPELDLLKHRLAPVSRAVAEEEIHFRLAAGRIAHVPLDGLLERLKDQVSARRSLVAKFHRYNGAVGPVQGFRMEYVVQRDSLPPLKALEYGKSPYRISVSRWQIHPTETLVAETVEDALRLGSRFRQILERTYPETAITIWLYPDDFEHFHQLRQFAHQLDLRVAARPLPDGFPITASPSGSRSSSQ